MPVSANDQGCDFFTERFERFHAIHVVFKQDCIADFVRPHIVNERIGHTRACEARKEMLPHGDSVMHSTCALRQTYSGHTQLYYTKIYRGKDTEYMYSTSPRTVPFTT